MMTDWLCPQMFDFFENQRIFPLKINLQRPKKPSLFSSFRIVYERVNENHVLEHPNEKDCQLQRADLAVLCLILSVLLHLQSK